MDAEGLCCGGGPGGGSVSPLEVRPDHLTLFPLPSTVRVGVSAPAVMLPPHCLSS